MGYKFNPFTGTFDVVASVFKGGKAGLVPKSDETSQNNYLRGDGTWDVPPGGGDMLQANNLSDLADIPTARNNLDVYSKAESDHISSRSNALIIISETSTAVTGTFTTQGQINPFTTPMSVVLDFVAGATPGSSTDICTVFESLGGFISVAHLSSGELLISAFNASPSSLFPSFTTPITPGQRYQVVLVINAPDNAYDIWVNGQDVANGALDNPPDDSPFAGYSLGGSDGTQFNFVGMYSLALTSQHVAEIYSDLRTAIRPTWRWGGLTYESNFSAGVGGWFADNGTRTTEVIAGREALTYETTSAGNVIRLYRARQFEYPYSYRVGLWIYIPSTNVSFNRARVGPGYVLDRTDPTSDRYFWGEVTTLDEWVYVETIFSPTATQTRDLNVGFYATDGSHVAVGDKFSIADVVVERVEACVLALTPETLQPAPGQWLDASVNKSHGLQAATGTELALPKDRFTFTWTRVSSGFLGNADRNVLPEGFEIEDIRWIDTKDTKTTASLGFSSGNNNVHVASFTPTQNVTQATLAASSANQTNRRLYINMSANAGAVTVEVSGRIKTYIS